MMGSKKTFFFLIHSKDTGSHTAAVELRKKMYVMLLIYYNSTPQKNYTKVFYFMLHPNHVIGSLKKDSVRSFLS